MNAKALSECDKELFDTSIALQDASRNCGKCIDLRTDCSLGEVCVTITSIQIFLSSFWTFFLVMFSFTL